MTLGGPFRLMILTSVWENTDPFKTSARFLLDGFCVEGHFGRREGGGLAKVERCLPAGWSPPPPSPSAPPSAPPSPPCQQDHS